MLSSITWSWILAIGIGFLGISVMIMVHELGHLSAARACGINVEMLRFGFGPTIFKWEKGSTEYRIGLIPFGGLCKMSGHDDIQNAIDQGKKHIETCEDGSIFSVGPIKRIIAYIAGPLANMIFAFLCYAILLSVTVLTPASPARIVLTSDYDNLYPNAVCSAALAGLRTGDTIYAVNGSKVSTYEELQALLKECKDMDDVLFETDRGSFHVHPNGMFGILPFKEPIVGHVNLESEEKKAGLKTGDHIISANGIPVTNMFDLLESSVRFDRITFVVMRGNDSTEITFENEGTALEFTLLQQTQKVKGMGFFKALWVSGRECLKNFKDSASSLIKVIRGKAEAHETLGGTFAASESIGMLTTKGFAAGFNNGIRVVLFLLASVSISLCVANLLPIPALDGGLILISLAELVTRRTFNPKAYVILQTVGIIMIFGAIALLSFS